MALNNGPLEDAGRDYYARQFDGRIQNIRKPGATQPPSSRGSRGPGAGGVIGGVVLALFILIRLFAGCAGAGSSSYDSSYTPSYNFTPPPVIDLPPPPPVLNNNGPDDPRWPPDLGDPPNVPIFNPPVGADNPGVEQPNDQPGNPAPDPAGGRMDPDRDR